MWVYVCYKERHIVHSGWGQFLVSYKNYQQTILCGWCSAGALIMLPSRPSVRPAPRFSRNGKAIETSNLVETQRCTRLTMGANLTSKGQRSRSLGMKMCKLFICIRRKKWIHLHQILIKMITDPFYAYRRIHFISGSALFCDNLWSVINRSPGGHHVVAATWVRERIQQAFLLFSQLLRSWVSN